MSNYNEYLEQLKSQRSQPDFYRLRARLNEKLQSRFWLDRPRQLAPWAAAMAIALLGFSFYLTSFSPLGEKTTLLNYVLVEDKIDGNGALLSYVFEK